MPGHSARENRETPVEAMELLLSKMGKTKSNAQFLGAMANGK